MSSFIVALCLLASAAEAYLLAVFGQHSTFSRCSSPGAKCIGREEREKNTGTMFLLASGRILTRTRMKNGGRDGMGTVDGGEEGEDNIDVDLRLPSDRGIKGASERTREAKPSKIGKKNKKKFDDENKSIGTEEWGERARLKEKGKKSARERMWDTESVEVQDILAAGDGRMSSKPPSATSFGGLTTRDGGRFNINNNNSGGRSSRRPFATEATGIPPIYFAFSDVSHLSDTFAPPPHSPGAPRESSSTTSTVGGRSRRRELHALRLVKVEEARLFWSVFDEIIYDAARCNRTSGQHYNRQSILDGFAQGRMYSLTCDDVDLEATSALFCGMDAEGWLSSRESANLRLLPCFCVVSADRADEVENIWVHPRVRRRGLGRTLLEQLDLSSASYPMPESLPFWKACGIDLSSTRDSAALDLW